MPNCRELQKTLGSPLRGYGCGPHTIVLMKQDRSSLILTKSTVKRFVKFDYCSVTVTLCALWALSSTYLEPVANVIWYRCNKYMRGGIADPKDCSLKGERTPPGRQSAKSNRDLRRWALVERRRANRLLTQIEKRFERMSLGGGRLILHTWRSYRASTQSNRALLVLQDTDGYAPQKNTVRIERKASTGTFQVSSFYPPSVPFQTNMNNHVSNVIKQGVQTLYSQEVCSDHLLTVIALNL